MDCQPVNLFIRGVSFGGLVRLAQPMTMYKYLTTKFHQAIISDPKVASRLPPPIYITNYRYYTSYEALRALSLPGPPPTHVLEIDLAAGVELQGPAFVNPLSPSSAFSLPREHRHGNRYRVSPVNPSISSILDRSLSG